MIQGAATNPLFSYTKKVYGLFERFNPIDRINIALLYEARWCYLDGTFLTLQRAFVIVRLCLPSCNE